MAQPQQFYSVTAGVYSEQSGPNAWAMLGTLALGEELPAAAGEGLRSQVLANGGWEWARGWGADTNSTALALQALVAAGEPPTSTVVAGGVAFLKSAQNADGGFAYALEGGAPGASDANSTAYVVQALAAVGEDPRGASWQVGGVGPIDYLLSLREADGGFAWQKGTGSNQLATQQVIPSLLGRAYPPAQGTGAPEACAGVFLPGVQR
jgi:squalene cyclase